MTENEKNVSDYIDELALKIVMVEPGDLSVVGELLDLLEKLLASDGVKAFPYLSPLVVQFKAAIEKLIMAELDDTVENYERFGNCIGQFQELIRKGGKPEGIVEKFYEYLAETGYVVETKASEPGLSTDKNEEEKKESTVPDSAAAEKSGETPDFLKDVELLSGFVEESFEHLEGIEVSILDLEQNPDDLEIINNIFRPFHTIKGVSGFLNLKDINVLAHTTENLLDDVRNGKRGMDPEVIDIVLAVGDQLREMVKNIKDVIENGMEHYVGFDTSALIAQIKAVQSGEALSTEDEDVVFEAEEEFLLAEEKVETATKVEAVVKTEKKAGSAISRTGKKIAAPARKGDISASIKVDIEKLDNLVNAVGELVIMQAMVRQNPKITVIADPKLNRDFSQLSRITSELQKTAMSMRMVPIRQTFQKMIRLVRDLSKKSGKVVDLIMVGEETEIDRNMVDSIYDPLVHMIRNSVDHGVQPPDEREQIGKPRIGTVHLRAYQKGGNIVIEIEDDGQGLNTEKIRSKAIARGLIGETDSMTDHELNNLIFLPGFSTADKITDVSGRGVGMDVVKKAVEKLRGKVEVVSTPGKGSQFIIRLPLTLAIIDGIIVRIGEERYIIPTIAIQESLKPLKENYNTVYGKGETLLVRETLIPIIRLYELFGVEPSNTDPCEAIMVIVESEGQQRALMVDELLGKQEVVIKSLGGYMKDINGVAGGTILADGRVGLILDMAGIISQSTASGSQRTDEF